MEMLCGVQDLMALVQMSVEYEREKKYANLKILVDNVPRISIREADVGEHVHSMLGRRMTKV